MATFSKTCLLRKAAVLQLLVASLPTLLSQVVPLELKYYTLAQPPTLHTPLASSFPIDALQGNLYHEIG